MMEFSDMLDEWLVWMLWSGEIADISSTGPKRGTLASDTGDTARDRMTADDNFMRSIVAQQFSARGAKINQLSFENDWIKWLRINTNLLIYRSACITLTLTSSKYLQKCRSLYIKGKSLSPVFDYVIGIFLLANNRAILEVSLFLNLIWTKL